MNPNACWWLKMDGCDLVKGIGESVDQVWTGDVDLADGVLQEQHTCYLDRLEFTTNFGLKNSVAGDVALCEVQFADDYSFVTTSKSNCE
jgi:hypothetical protein